MTEYHKIQTVFKRDPNTKYKTLLIDEYSRPEFEYLKDNDWVFTEKVDGTNIRIMWNGLDLKLGGKSDNAQIPTPLVNHLSDKFHKTMFSKTFGDDGGVCLYGEGYGGKIQKAGATYGGEQRFILFDVKVGDWWLQREDVMDVASKFDITVVPVCGAGTLNEMLIKVRTGLTSSWGDFTAEGIVARPATEIMARNGQRIITKLKHKDFKSD